MCAIVLRHKVLILRGSCKSRFSAGFSTLIKYSGEPLRPSSMAQILEIWNHVQRRLFPMLEEEMGELTEKDRHFVRVVSLVTLDPFLEPYRWSGVGCPPKERACIARAFIAKAVYQFPTTRALLDALQARPVLRRLCRWESIGEIPSEATFSRAFADFSADELTQRIHAAMVQQHWGPKLVGHISRDATAIDAREKPAPKAPL